MERTLQDRLKYIKKIRDEHCLSPVQIMEICDKNGAYVSDKTITKLLREDSEELRFHFHSVVSVYEGLYNKFGDDAAPDDVIALKHIIAERNRQIDNLLLQIETMVSDHKNTIELYDERKAAYERNIINLESQLTIMNECYKNLFDAYLAGNSAKFRKSGE